ncbi:MAG: ATP-binding protein [Gammaproteobacteria bacterium]
MFDKQLLKSLVLEQKKSLIAERQGIAREKYSELIAHLPIPHALIIAGLRRAGKSTMLLQLIEQEFHGDVYYFDLEDERLVGFTVQDFNTLYAVMLELYGEKKVFFLDEVQNILEWERFVRRLQDDKVKFVITGSNASLLSVELGTKLTGRYVQIELFPYSFREFLNACEISFNENSFLITNERALLKKQFNEYMQVGGIPEFVAYRAPHILTTLYENIIYKDIIVRYELHAVRAFRELAIYLMSNIGSLISYTKLKNILNLGSVNTVKNYIHYLENAYLIFTIDGYAYSVLQQTVSQKKVYAIDTGLVQAVSIQFSANTGRYIENIVFLELRRRYQEIYYYRTQNNLEVDFLVRVKHKILLIQVCESLSQEKTRQRELTALTTAMTELNIQQGLILTLDEHETVSIENHEITVMPIYQWLLTSESKGI